MTDRTSEHSIVAATHRPFVGLDGSSTLPPFALCVTDLRRRACAGASIPIRVPEPMAGDGANVIGGPWRAMHDVMTRDHRRRSMHEPSRTAAPVPSDRVTMSRKPIWRSRFDLGHSAPGVET